MSKKQTHESTPHYNLRRAGAIGAIGLTAFGAYEASGKVKDIVSDANAANGREVPAQVLHRSNVRVVGGTESVQIGGAQVKVEHDPNAIAYKSTIFGAGHNNVRGETDALVPDEDPNIAVNAYSTYLRPEDQAAHRVHPQQEVTVALDSETGTVIPAEELTPEQRAHTSAPSEK